MAGDHDHLRVGRRLLRPGQDLEAADIVHHQVGDDHVEGILIDLPGSLRAAANHHDLIVEPTQHLAHGAGMDDVVVNHEHAHEPLQPGGWRCMRGRRRVPWLSHDVFDGTKPPFAPSSWWAAAAARS